MTLVRTCQQLQEALHALGGAVQALHVSVVEDRPPKDDVALTDLFGDALEEIAGRVEECAQGLAPHLPTPDRPSAGVVLWQALACCQSNFGDLQFRCFDLLAYGRLAPLVQLGRRRGGEWQSWAIGVRTGLEQLPPLLYAVQQSLTACWQELGEQVGPPRVLIQHW
ncbi:MAG: hypothetical protein R2867_22955 [Caldilineaceae bacterium]